MRFEALLGGFCTRLLLLDLYYIVFVVVQTNLTHLIVNISLCTLVFQKTFNKKGSLKEMSMKNIISRRSDTYILILGMR